MITAKEIKDKANIINEIASKKLDVSQVVEMLFH